jgi:glutamyl-tRNA(Gln) amidotransferase subunit E
MDGIFGYLPYEGIRLGKEIAELVRFFGIGGVFHSDELPNYGIEKSDLDGLKNSLEINENDAFLVLAAPEEKIHIVIDQIILRMEHIKNQGIPIDTRLATPTGETKFLRPRPGAARMYPETDIPPIIITENELINAEENIPKLWDEAIKEIEVKYEMNQQLAEQIFDSRYIELFENIIKKIKTNPTFVASILCSTITNLERKGLDSNLLENQEIFKLFELLEKGEIAKESIEIIFENIMSKKSQNVEEAMKNTAIESINEKDLDIIIKDIVDQNQEIIKNQKERAIGPLMGIVMKKLRGKASGEIINNLLLKNIKKKLENN